MADLSLRSPRYPCTRLHPIGHEAFEVLWLDVVMSSKCYLICLIYFPPPDAQYREQLSEHVILTYETLCQIKNYSSFFLHGDFNQLNCEDILTECSLTQLNFEPTHGNNVIGRIYSTNNVHSYGIYTTSTALPSDHLSVVCSIFCQRPMRRVVFFSEIKEGSIVNGFVDYCLLRHL